MSRASQRTDLGGAPPGDPRSEGGEAGPPRAKPKARRTLTPHNVLTTIGRSVCASPVLIRAYIRPKIPFVLREKLYLAVTSINECRFCEWGHTHWALAHGVPLAEVNQLLGREAVSLVAGTEAEAVAILFARHYAEHLERVDPDSLQNLRKYYSNAQIKEILAHLRFITLTNLSGNTVDAFLGRFRRPPEPVGAFQFVAGAALSPILLLIVSMAKIERALGAVTRRSQLYDPRHGTRTEAGQAHKGDA